MVFSGTLLQSGYKHPVTGLKKKEKATTASLFITKTE
jgi:hypothetical protein